MARWRISAKKATEIGENYAEIVKNNRKRGPGRAEEGKVSPAAIVALPRGARGMIFIDFMLIYADFGSFWGSILANFPCLFRCDLRHGFLVAPGSDFHDILGSFS